MIPRQRILSPCRRGGTRARCSRAATSSGSSAARAPWGWQSLSPCHEAEEACSALVARIARIERNRRAGTEADRRVEAAAATWCRGPESGSPVRAASLVAPPCRITLSVFRNTKTEAKSTPKRGLRTRFRVVPLISGGFGVVKRSGVAEELVVDIICEKLGGKNHQSPSQNSLSPSHIITWSPQCSSLAPKLRFRPPSPGGPPL